MVTGSALSKISELYHWVEGIVNENGSSGTVCLSLDSLNELKASLGEIKGARQAEEALIKCHYRLAEVLESITDGFFSVDKNWIFTYVNKRAAKVIGHEPKDLIGRNLWEDFPEIAGTHLGSAYRKAMDEEVAQYTEIRGLQTGQWYSISIYPSAEGISVYWRDISERKLLEETSQCSLDQLQIIIKHMSDGLMVADSEGKIILVNPSMIQLADWREAPEEPIQEYMRRVEARYSDGRLLPPEEWPISRTLRGEVVRDVELSVKRLDTGKNYIALYSAVPICDSSGRVALAVATVRDITERKKAEEALQKAKG